GTVAGQDDVQLQLLALALEVVLDLLQGAGGRLALDEVPALLAGVALAADHLDLDRLADDRPGGRVAFFLVVGLAALVGVFRGAVLGLLAGAALVLAGAGGAAGAGSETPAA